MKDIIEYINKKNNDFEIIVEELSKSELNGNKLIKSTEKYNIYCGGHLFSRLNRHVEDSYNPGDKIPMKSVLNTIENGFYHIENCYNSGKIELNNPNSCICLVNKKYFEPLNIVLFINKFNKDNTYDITLKTVMFKKNFGSELKRYINEDIVESIIFIEV